VRPGGKSRLAQPAPAGRGFPQGQDGLVIGEKNRVAAAARQESHAGVGLALVRLKTERQLTVTRDELGLNFRGKGMNLMVRESILCGLHPLKKTKPYHCDKCKASTSAAERNALHCSLPLIGNVEVREHKQPPL
jgi:hypothetical protein